MQGLLGDSIDDPRTMAVLQGVMGLLGARGNVQGIAQGLLGYQGAMQQAKQQKAQEEERAMRRQLAELQLRQAQLQAAKAQAIDAAYKGAIRTPEQMAMAAHGGPTNAAAQATPGMAPGIDQNALIRGLMNSGAAQEAFQMLQPKPADLMALNPGQVVYNRSTGKEAFRAPDKPDDLPGAVREFQFAQQNPAFAAYQERLKRAGATNVSVSNAEKPLLNTVAEGLGKQIDASLENARAAVPAIQTAQTLKAAVDSGKVVSGPGASFRVAGLQIGQMLGIGGKDGAEVLSNTRSAIQSMAQAELNAAAQMKGQGQITESERDIIRRAASGRIDDLTAPEIKQLADVMEKTARFKIGQHKRNVSQLRSMQGAEALVPFYDIEEPPTYSGPPSSGVRRYNPATGRIE